MPETVAQAIKAAEAEQARYLEVQHRALHDEPDDRPDPQRYRARRSQPNSRKPVWRSRGAARRKPGEAARVEGDARRWRPGRPARRGGRTPSAEQVAEVRQLAELAAAIRARAAAHDAEVRGLHDEAAGLHGDPEHDPVERSGHQARGRPTCRRWASGTATVRFTSSAAA